MIVRVLVRLLVIGAVLAVAAVCMVIGGLGALALLTHSWVLSRS